MKKLFHLMFISLVLYGCQNSVETQEALDLLGQIKEGTSTESDTTSKIAAGITTLNSSTNLHHPLVAEMGVAVSPDFKSLYMSGGYEPWGDYDNRMYSFNGRAWEKHSVMPYQLIDHSLVFSADGSKLFIIGGG